eukprot:6195073-Pleurochrysis_carterae.AAC.1
MSMRTARIAGECRARMYGQGSQHTLQCTVAPRAAPLPPIGQAAPLALERREGRPERDFTSPLLSFLTLHARLALRAEAQGVEAGYYSGNENSNSLKSPHLQSSRVYYYTCMLALSQLVAGSFAQLLVDGSGVANSPAHGRRGSQNQTMYFIVAFQKGLFASFEMVCVMLHVSRTVWTSKLFYEGPSESRCNSLARSPRAAPPRRGVTHFRLHG